jgi:hypothetical protein
MVILVHSETNQIRKFKSLIIWKYCEIILISREDEMQKKLTSGQEKNGLQK